MRQENIWIFGYGSLMWNPGFSYVSQQKALLKGFKRDLCILSHAFRGTPEVPGLVLGLTQGEKCEGIAFEVDPQNKEAVFAYLHKREMINDVYQPTWVDLNLEDKRSVPAYTFLSRPEHPQFVAHYTLAQKFKLIAQGVGSVGTSLEYLKNTCAHLQKLSIEDPLLFHYLDNFYLNAQ